MRLFLFALLMCGLAGCEMSKTTTPNSTTVKIDPK